MLTNFYDPFGHKLYAFEFWSCYKRVIGNLWIIVLKIWQVWQSGDSVTFNNNFFFFLSFCFFFFFFLPTWFNRKRCCYAGVLFCSITSQFKHLKSKTQDPAEIKFVGHLFHLFLWNINYQDKYALLHLIVIVHPLCWANEFFYLFIHT